MKNVLILTPEHAGSTLLQRLIAIYMQGQGSDPVIDVDDLTTGLMKYQNTEHSREMLAKFDRPWSFYQSPAAIVDALATTNHFKVAKLSYHALMKRLDSPELLAPLYQYLNDNFYIVGARRNNTLDHALSWAIAKENKNGNVYNLAKKFEDFFYMYRDKINVDTSEFNKYFTQYQDYLNWEQTNFRVDSYFYYEQHITDLENYILSLDIFSAPPQSWTNRFGLNLDSWNRFHYLFSDVSGIGRQLEQVSDFSALDLQKLVSSLEDTEITYTSIMDIIVDSLSVDNQEFLLEHGDRYQQSILDIKSLVANKILASEIPVKLQTMLEKQLLINNFDQCAQQAPNDQFSQANIVKEIKYWHG